MKTATAAALAAGAAVAVYWGALSAGFVGDDFMILHRLREGGSLLRFFRGEFFEYYRPLGFVAHAIDYRLAGASAAQFHATNLLLHVASTVLVLLIGRALSPRAIAGPLAAFLFALHAANHEAVVWISARFDLLATCFSLLAVWLLVRRDGGGQVVTVARKNYDATPVAAAAAFLGAVLSKEAAIALPIAAAGYAVFRKHGSTRDTVAQLTPWLAALVIYSLMRHLGGGISTIGGAGKLPKLAAFGLLLVVFVLLADDRWTTLRRWLQAHAWLAAALAASGIAATAALAAATGGSGLAADKLAVAGFAIVNLVSPIVDLFDMPFYLVPGTTAYWAGGAIALAGAGVLAALAWRRLLQDDRAWFLGAFLLATLLPITALTEGTRYLYLPSAALALLVAVVVAELPAGTRGMATAVLAALTAVSAWQVVRKVHDWQWAGRLTADGARLVDASLAPSCGEGHVVFLTEPVALRATYTHFLYETFERPRGCMPAQFDILARVQRIDTRIEARWQGDREIVLVAPQYRGNLSLSPDLRNFSPPIRSAAPLDLDTPLGRVRAEGDGTAERVSLTLAPGLDPRQVRFFYYSDGAMHELTK
jgi:hypothetical protein